MKFSKQVRWKIGIGIILILVGILSKRLFHWGAGIMIFHLAGGILIAAGIVQSWMDKKSS